MPVTIDQKLVQSFGNLELIAKQVVEGFITGLHKSPFHGFSVEFSEHRPYNQGESIRHIDWKLFGRSDKLYTKRFEEETNLRCQIIIDNSSSMYYPVTKDISVSNPNKIIFSIYAAASLIYLLRLQRDAVGLSIFSEKVEEHLSAHSTITHQKVIYQSLEKMMHPFIEGGNKKTFAAEALHDIAEMIHKRSLVVIFSDMMESNTETNELFAALQHLKHNKHEIILFHVTDKSKELDFSFDNRPYRFIDMESAEEIKLNPAEIKDRYLEAINHFRNELKLRCSQYHIDLVEADINQGFHHVLLSYLLKRKRMF
ncbi:MAG TPA: DUF58 domain-containing protein [Bacteroidales bacterium]|jgi:uncharacterized protein (DUF58 family)|nr:DUF58 domain-containing protein [Bacteroidales bacterium]HNZ43136.1 DUF58 domain-containing protein [Bacteroidales bacterium]HOH83584.1 DUF58 domain-containing protein [Bacteroidales bacterium]HPB25878.1 DUF58 domain-containing protein [Bacteroidales bacterium]HPI30684.1 DUF58 domain-containing protein [Bacteroidales bacterium]